MVARVSSRPKAPQLPPLRPLSFYPPHAAGMALTSIGRPTVTARSSQRIILNGPLLRPPAMDAHFPQRTSAHYTDTIASLKPQKPSAYQPLPNYFLRSNHTPLVFALREPNVLRTLLCQLEWSESYNLFTSCKLLSAFFDATPLRDVVLARFIPEYAQCLRNRDMQHYQDIPITVLDLDLLLISQRVPLHRYPIHALRMQSSMLPALEDDHLREKLVVLTQAHSRFVLLLQSLVHSSSAALPQETEEGPYRPRFSPIQSLRELTFPAPLAYSEPPAPPPKGITTPGKSKHARHKSTPISPVVGRHASFSILTYPPNLPASPRPLADAASSMISNANSISSNRSPPLKKGRRVSFFGKKSPSPPPPDEPRALRVYSSTWKRTSHYGSYGDISDDSAFGALKRPKRLQHHRLGSINDSSDSSLSNHSPLSQSRSRNSMVVQPEALASSPHDLILATSRVRAPILRVFVPCTKLDADSDSLVECEQQLVESGLWSHLSTGDVVCNLGFVPPPEDDGSSEGEAGEFIMMRPGASSGLAGGAYQKWLLFNGHVLVPYTPPDLLPLGQPLTLPTPFYFAHVMPPFTNLSYDIQQLPVCDDVPQLTLVNSTKKVKSPHSPNGFAIVNKYSWIARVVRMRADSDGEMGEGWFGEWILEGEGTPEGKLLLVNALKGVNMGHREWELIREKSGGGKLWLRIC